MLNVLSLVALAVVMALALSVLVGQAVTGVPPMSASAAEAGDVVALLQQSGLSEHAVIYDLGCGWGAMVIALARAFPQAQVRGVELSPLPYWVARIRTRNLPNVSLRRGDFFHTDVGDADAITCFLLIKSMQRLAGFLDDNLKPGTAVAAVAFWFRDRRASAFRQGGGLLSQVALYHWPASS
jgi:cyclopropane fatty-acyl-phospholipid synthase-like methyltransferase